MKWISLIFLFHLLNSSNGCLKLRQLGLTTTQPRRTTPPPPCSCGDFFDFIEEPVTMLYTQYPGCRANVTCILDDFSFLFAYWGDIPKPENVIESVFAILSIKHGSNAHEFIDMYEHFGIFCQDGKWYASKFPAGISYWTENAVREVVYEDGGLEGKTAEISGIYCAPLPPIEQTTPEPVWTTPPPICSCGNLSDIIEEPEAMLYTQYPGCRANVTCISDTFSFLFAHWGDIPKPENAIDAGFVIQTNKDGSNVYEFIDMYEYFGIYCQDGKWYASKFPVGILYWTDVLESVYEDRGLEEKTAEISGIYCAPLPSIEQTTPKPVWTTPPPQCYCGVFNVFIMQHSEEMLYTQLDGCRANVTCISDYSTLLIGYWGEVPKPDDALDGTYFTLETYKDGSNNHQFVDLYEYFGIYCQPENERFYATKYPNGISYLTSDGLKYAYVDGGLEGKKTVLDRGPCAPPPPIEQTTPEPVSTTSPTPCPCGLFSASVVINSPDMLYTQLDGCRANVICFSDLSTLIVGKWGEIPKPDDASDNRVFAIETYIEGSNHKWIDLYEYFGIQCQPENGKFYVTKYPNGITYASGGSAKNAYTNGELDGKKTEIFDWRCGPPS